MNKIKFLVLTLLFCAGLNAAEKKSDNTCNNTDTCMVRDGSLEQLSICQMLDCHPCDCVQCCFCTLVCCIPAIYILACDTVHKLCCKADKNAPKKEAE